MRNTTTTSTAVGYYQESTSTKLLQSSTTSSVRRSQQQLPVLQPFLSHLRAFQRPHSSFQDVPRLLSLMLPVPLKLSLKMLQKLLFLMLIY